MNFYLLVLLLCFCPLQIETRRTCKASKGRYFSPDDQGLKVKCKFCSKCPAGKEWDTNATVRNSKDHGDLECYPCAPCKDGFYKEKDTLRTCSPCLLECVKLNRYLDVKCEGVRRGHCGSCLPGFDDPSGSTEMLCTPSGKEGLAENEMKSNKEVVEDEPKPPFISSDLKDLLLISVCTFLLAVLGITLYLGLTKCLRRNTIRSNTTAIVAQDVNSSTRLFQSSASLRDRTESNHVDVDLEMDGGLTESNKVDVDLEMDGDQTGVVRAELQSGGYSPVNTASYVYIRQGIMEYPMMILKKDDNLLSLISMKVDVKWASYLFQRLNVSKQTVDAEKVRYEKGIILYKDYILNMLIKWVCREAENATLNKLCTALKEANCSEALQVVDELSRSDIPTNTYITTS